MATKFSQFASGGNLASGDTIVGLRSGTNTKFDVGSILGNNWSVITAGQVLVINNDYFLNNGAPVILVLPVVSPVGSAISLANIGASTFSVTQNAGQSIKFGSATTTVGVGGSIASTATGDSLTLVCAVANTTWIVVGGSQGIWTIV